MNSIRIDIPQMGVWCDDCHDHNGVDNVIDMEMTCCKLRRACQEDLRRITKAGRDASGSARLIGSRDIKIITALSACPS